MTEPTLEEAAVGDRIMFAESRAVYTVQACDGRYLVCTRPFAPRKTVIYTVVDLTQRVRGPDDAIFCSGYESREQCQERLKELNDPHHYCGEGCGQIGRHSFPLAVSRRHGIPLKVARLRRGA